MLDRRLMQDDHRGLGQGVKDNMVTHELFRLLLEDRHSTASVSSGVYSETWLKKTINGHLWADAVAAIEWWLLSINIMEHCYLLGA